MSKPSEVVLERFSKLVYKPGEEIAIALDPAASEFYQDGNTLQEIGQIRQEFRTNMVKFYAKC